MTINVSPTPPVTPPAKIKISLDPPNGTVKLLWDPIGTMPETIVFDSNTGTVEIDLPDSTMGLVLESDGHQAVNVV